MKKRHLWLAALSLVLSICMCFALTACGKTPDESKPPKALAVPEVTIDADSGLASWHAVENASGYIYKISGGAEQETAQTSVQLSDGQSIVVAAKGDVDNYSDSAYSEAKTYNKKVVVNPAQLDVPNVTLNGAVASWKAVANASGYKYVIGDGAEQSTTSLSVTLTDGQSIKVKAVGNGTAYLDSAYSAAVKYTISITPTPDPVTLTAPVVTLDGAVASWTEVANASGYKYVIGDGESVATSELSVTLTNGQSIKVMAVGDGTAYLDSAYSEIVTYTAPTPDNPAKLTAPVVTLNGAVASWTAVANANGYKYVIDNNEAVATTELSVTLTDGQSIKVMAVGDGASYTDSDYSVTVTYTKPQPIKLGTPSLVISDAGVASWTAVANANGYKYVIDNNEAVATTELSVTLTKGQSIKVMAVGDNDGYADGDYSTPKAYIVSALKATISLAKGTTNTKFEDEQAIWSANGVTVTVDKNESSTKCTNYTLASTAHARFYTGSKITIEYAAMTRIVFVDGDKDRLLISSTDDYTVNVLEKGIEIKFYSARNSFVIEKFTKAFRVSEIKIYTEKVAQPLAIPEVSIDLDGVASWAEVANASGYKYVIGDGESVATSELSVTLTDGQSIKVMAVGDGEDYASSAYCEAQSYTMVPVTLAVPAVTVNNSGEASWNAVANASGYKYVIDNNEAVATIELSVTLTNGQSIKVMAVGNSASGGRFVDSAYSEIITYTQRAAEKLSAPAISVAKDGTVTVTLANADSFKYKINDGTEETLGETAVKLTSGQSFAAMAVGDGIGYSDSDYSAAVTYTAPVALGTPANVSVAVQGTDVGKVIVSWDAVASASGYNYKIDNGEATFTQDISIVISLEEAKTISVCAVGSNDAAFAAVEDGNFGALYSDSEYCAAVEFAIIRGNDKVYSVTEILKVMAYYGSNLPTQSFTVSGIVSKNDAYSAQYNYISFTLREGDKAFVVYRAKLATDVGSTTAKVDEYVGYTVTAAGQLEATTGSTPIMQLKAGCTVNSLTLTDDEGKVANAAARFTLPDTCTEEFELSLSAANDVTVTWTVVNAEAVADAFVYEGGTMVVERQAENVEVELKATFTFGAASLDKTFKVIVLKQGAEIPAPTLTFTFNIGSADSSTRYTDAKATEDFTAACCNSSLFTGITATSDVYPGKGLKFGTGSKSGSITLNFTKKVTKVVINCKKYSSDSGSFKVGDADAQVPPAEAGNLTFELATATDSIVIATTAKRGYILAITVTFEK